MTGTTHFLAGAAVGKLTGDPIAAAVFGLLIHFVMDLVPHWDYGYHFERKWKHFLAAGAEPFIGVAIWVLAGFVKGFSPEIWIITFIGGVFCLLPDAMTVFIKTFRLRFLFPLLIFHARVHWFIPDIKSTNLMEFETKKITKKGIMFGIIYQIPFIVASLWLLIR